VSSELRTKLNCTCACFICFILLEGIYHLLENSSGAWAQTKKGPTQLMKKNHTANLILGDLYEFLDEKGEPWPRLA
jgi:hypothetical protein